MRPNGMHIDTLEDRFGLVLYQRMEKLDYVFVIDPSLALKLIISKKPTEWPKSRVDVHPGQSGNNQKLLKNCASCCILC